MTDQTPRHTRALRKNALEWIVFALSLALITGTLGMLAYAALTEGNTPPELTLSLGDAQAHRGGFRVPLRIENTGDETAAQVLVEITSGGETAQVTFQYVPRRSAREGSALFQQHPEAPTARIVSYELP